jgi:hypothetical protein
MTTHDHFCRMLAALALLAACYALGATFSLFSASRSSAASAEATTLIRPGGSQPERSLFHIVTDCRDAGPMLLPGQEQGLLILTASPVVQLADNEEDDGEENGGDGEKDDAAKSEGGGNPEHIWDRVKRG